LCVLSLKKLFNSTKWILIQQNYAYPMQKPETTRRRIRRESQNPDAHVETPRRRTAARFAAARLGGEDLQTAGSTRFAASERFAQAIVYHFVPL
jgi:hypothetical protein